MAPLGESEHVIGPLTTSATANTVDAILECGVREGTGFHLGKPGQHKARRCRVTAQHTGFENKHLEVPQDSDLVDLATNTYGMFFWEVTGTQTVVARESHLESGKFNEDNLYSVTTTERFVSIDLRRATDIPNLGKIKELEQQYFHLCTELSNIGGSPLDNYSSNPVSPPKEVIPSLFDGAVYCDTRPSTSSGPTGQFVASSPRNGIMVSSEEIGINWVGVVVGAVFYVIPGILYYIYCKKTYPKKVQEYETEVAAWGSLKSRLDVLMRDNRSILNLPA